MYKRVTASNVSLGLPPYKVIHLEDLSNVDIVSWIRIGEGYLSCRHQDVEDVYDS